MKLKKIPYFKKKISLLTVMTAVLFSGESNTKAQTTESEALYAAGMELFNSADYRKAAGKFRKAWEIDSLSNENYLLKYENALDWEVYSLLKSGDRKAASGLDARFFDLKPADKSGLSSIDHYLDSYHTKVTDGMYAIASMDLEYALEETEKQLGVTSKEFMNLAGALLVHYFENKEVRKMQNLADRLEKLYASTGGTHVFIPGLCTLMKGWYNLSQGKEKEALECARTTARLFKGYESKFPYESGQLLFLMSDIVFYCNPELFPGGESALAEVQSLLDSDIKAFESLSDQERLDKAMVLLQSIVETLRIMPAKDFDSTERLLAGYADMLEKADFEKYPGAEVLLASVLTTRSNYLNERCNLTGTGFDTLMEYTSKALDILGRHPEIEKRQYTSLMNICANAALYLQQFDKAMELLDEVAQIASNPANNCSQDFFDAVKGKAIAHQRQGRTDRSVEVLRNNISTVRNLKKSYPVQTGDYLMSLASFLSSDQRNKKEIIGYLKEALDCFNKVDSEATLRFSTDCAINLANLEATGPEDCVARLSEVEKKFDESVSRLNLKGEYVIREKAVLKNAMASALLHTDPEKALEYNTEAIDLIEKSGLFIDFNFLDTEMSILMALQRYADCRDLGQRKLELAKSILGKNDIITLRAMLDMNDLYDGNLEYDKSEKMTEEIVKVLEVSAPSLSPDNYLGFILRLSNHYMLHGEYEKAFKLFSDEIPHKKEIERRPELLLPWRINYLKAKAFTPQKDEVIEECRKLARICMESTMSNEEKYQSILTLASVANSLGEIGYAADWYDKAIALYGDNDKTRIEYLGLLSDYITLLQQLGQTDKINKATREYLEGLTALAENESKFESDVMDILKSVLLMGNDISMLGEKGEDYIDNLYSLVSTKFGLSSHITQSVAKVKIQGESFFGKPIDEIFSGVYPVIEAVRAENKNFDTELLIMMSELAKGSSRIAEAEEIMADIGRIPDSQIKPTQKVRILSMKGKLALERKDITGGLRYYREAFESARDYVLDKFLTMSAEERDGFWNQSYSFFKYDIPDAAGYAMKISESEFPLLVNDAALFTNSLLLSSDVTVDEAASGSKDKGIRKSYNHYLKLKQEVAEAEKQISRLNQPDPSREDELSALRAELLKSERELLTRMSDRLGHYNRHLAISTEDVRNTLGPDQAAVEFLEVPVDWKSANMVYLASIVRGDRNDVELIPLFTASPDDDIWEDCYDTEKLTDAIWGNLSVHLQGVKDIWFAPQGRLMVTAIESLPGLDKIDLGVPFTLHRLTSTRQLVLESMKESERKGKKGNKEFVAYGGIDYGASGREVHERASQESGRAARRSVLSQSDLLRNDKFRKASAGIEPLPGTETEANYIADLIRQTKSGHATCLNGTKATEASFKNLSGNAPVLLHIGTHGFYFDDIDGTGKHRNGTSSMSAEELAMRHSGLLLAGADTGLYHPEVLPDDAEDGVLTASEISRLDLSDTDLIVMSACETGLGRISSDGVFGLQRGFKKAGAGALMMSLWKVDDEATTTLMKAFYDGWLKEGLTRSEALRRAKEKVRSEPKWNNPVYWAPFVLLDAVDLSSR